MARPISRAEPRTASRLTSGGGHSQALSATGSAHPSALSLRERTAHSDYASQACALIARVDTTPDTAEAVHLLRLTTQALGADGAVFISCVRDDATLTTYRLLMACDPQWGVLYVANGWFADDPWLQHALNSTEPALQSDLPPRNERQHAMLAAAAQHGFRSAAVFPAPSSAGVARVGMLCLGSHQRHFFEDTGFVKLRCLARSLAMELHQWWLRRIRQELIAQAKLSDDDLALLRFGQQGLSSKGIGQALGIEAKTVDCRFQRLNNRLGMGSRRTAVRLAELYDLL